MLERGEGDMSSDAKREKRFVGVFLFLICLVMAHAVHAGWFTTAYEMQVHPPATVALYTPLFERATHLPDAYRVAMPSLGQLVMRVSHVHDAPVVAAVFDFIFGFAACWVFYRLAVDFLMETGLVAVLFLAMIQFAMSWVVPWQRTETMPTSLFLAVMLFSLGRVRQSLLWVWVIVAATLIQGFVRTDVPVILGIAMVVLSFFPGELAMFGSRRLLLSLGGLVALITIMIQVYLRYVQFPGLHRWSSDVPVFTLGWNLHHFHAVVIGVVALLPFVLFAIFLLIKRPVLDASDRLVLLVSGVYLVVWLTAGLLSEARIFVPFMLALSSVAAKVLGSYEPIVEPARRLSS